MNSNPANANKYRSRATAYMLRNRQAINNAGTWNTAGGSNDFGAGVDSVANNGVVLAANNAGAAETTTFNNLESFSNNAGGGIYMTDGAVGDKTVFTGGVGIGNYVGNGGGIYIDTFLDDGAVPFSDSDVLVIGGNSTGNSTLFVSATGPGALTTGDGIEVVQVDGTSAGVFTLGNGPLIAGAFSYGLFQNGVTDPTDGDWYLRSTYSPSTPVYETLPQVLQGLNGVPTLQQRVGNRYWNGAPQEVFCKDASKNYRCAVTAEQAATYADGKGAPVIDDQALWVRIEGSHGHYEPDTSTTGASFDQDLWKLQGGIDGLLPSSRHSQSHYYPW